MSAGKTAPGKVISDESECSVPDISLLFARLDGKTADAQPVVSERKPWESLVYGLELRGTVSGTVAVVRIKDTGTEQLLHPGDVINGGKVGEISRNRLVITGVKGEETLVLPSERPGKCTPRKTPPGKVSREQLAMLLQNLDRLAEEISIEPVRKAEGGPAGYKIVSLKPRGILAGMGLRKNDFILEINHHVIRSPQDVYETFEQAQHANQLNIKLRRNQHNVELVYQII